MKKEDGCGNENNSNKWKVINLGGERKAQNTFFGSFYKQRYTKPTDSMKNIYLTVEKMIRYRKQAPKEATKEDQRFGNYFCLHETHGHNSNGCRHLKDMIKE